MIPAGLSQKMKAEKVKNDNTNLPFLAVFNVYINIVFAQLSRRGHLFMSDFLVPLMFMGLWTFVDLDLLDFLDLVLQTFKITTNESQTLYLLLVPPTPHSSSRQTQGCCP